MPFTHSIWSPKGIKICELMHLNRVTWHRWTTNRNKSIQAANMRWTRVMRYRSLVCLEVLWLSSHCLTVAAAFTSVTTAEARPPSSSNPGSVVQNVRRNIGWSLRGQSQTQQDCCKGLWENHLCLRFIVEKIFFLKHIVWNIQKGFLPCSLRDC